MRKLSALPLLALLLAGPVSAADKKSDSEGQFVNLSSVALPVITEGRVRNYVFVNLRLDLSEKVDPKIWRDKEPYFRDALVRLGHRTPFTLAKDWSSLDEPALKRSMLVEAGRIAGPGVVTAVEIIRAAPQRRLVGTAGGR